MPHKPPTGHTRIVISHADYARASETFRAHLSVDANDPTIVCGVCLCTDCKLYRDLIVQATYAEAIDNLMRKQGSAAVQAMMRNRRNRTF